MTHKNDGALLFTPTFEALLNLHSLTFVRVARAAAAAALACAASRSALKARSPAAAAIASASSLPRLMSCEAFAVSWAASASRRASSA